MVGLASAALAIDYGRFSLVVAWSLLIFEWDHLPVVSRIGAVRNRRRISELRGGAL